MATFDWFLFWINLKLLSFWKFRRLMPLVILSILHRSSDFENQILLFCFLLKIANQPWMLVSSFSFCSGICLLLLPIFFILLEIAVCCHCFQWTMFDLILCSLFSLFCFTVFDCFWNTYNFQALDSGFLFDMKKCFFFCLIVNMDLVHGHYNSLIFY